MSKETRIEWLDNPHKLSRYKFDDKKVYKDLLSFRNGILSEETFNKKYLRRAAIFSLNMTGITKMAIKKGSLYSLIKIINMQSICGPVLEQFNAIHIRAFADDMVALFEDPNDALNAAFLIHQIINNHNIQHTKKDSLSKCCIGIGYGDVYSIGIDHAMGDEMNRTSKLGEDIARGTETLITENAYLNLQNRDDCIFHKRYQEGVAFAFYDVIQQA